MQGVEGRQPEAIRGVKKLEDLSHKFGGMCVGGVPGIRENEIIGAGKLQAPARCRLIEHDLRVRGIDHSAGDQGTVHVMEAHRSEVGTGDAAELHFAPLG